MKKRGKKKEVSIHIHLSNRWLYTLIAIGIISILGVVVYAYGTSNPFVFGHSLNELERCAEGQTLRVSSGSWVCVDTSQTETDPTVKDWAKTDDPLIPGSITANSGRSPIYLVTATVCTISSNTLTISSTCSTGVCMTSGFGVRYYYRCDGSCGGHTSPNNCNNQFLGSLV